MTGLESNLAPFYGPKTEYAAGMSRATLVELRAYFMAKVEEFDRIGVCANCEHFTARPKARMCKQFGEIPAQFDGRDCVTWLWDGVPW